MAHKPEKHSRSSHAAVDELDIEQTQPSADPQFPSTPESPEPPSGLIVQPLVGTNPPPLGKTPTSIAQMMPKPPVGQRATHFIGPVVSGPPPGANAIQGAAVLTLSLLLDYSMGNFSIPIQFPQDSTLLYVFTNEIVAFSAAEPDIGLGSQVNGTDIMAALPLTGIVGKQVQTVPNSLPTWAAASPKVPFQAWLTVTLNTGNSAGLALIVFGYARIPTPWS